MRCENHCMHMAAQHAGTKIGCSTVTVALTGHSSMHFDEWRGQEDLAAAKHMTRIHRLF